VFVAVSNSLSGCKCLLLSPSVLESVCECSFLSRTALDCGWVSVVVPYSVGVCGGICCLTYSAGVCVGEPCCPLQR
jgi:hypothetical protein